MLKLDQTSKGDASCDAKIKHTKILQKNFSFLGSGEIGFIWLNQKKKKKRYLLHSGNGPELRLFLAWRKREEHKTKHIFLS